MKRKARRPVRRNPDLEARRSWEADRSDQAALYRYISSLIRDGINNMEEAVIINRFLGICDPLRMAYTKSLMNNWKTKKIKYSDWAKYVSKNMSHEEYYVDEGGEEFIYSDVNSAEVLSFIEIGSRLGFDYCKMYNHIDHVTDYGLVGGQLLEILGCDDYNQINPETLINYLSENRHGINSNYAYLVPALLHLINRNNLIYAAESLRFIRIIGIATYNTIDYLVHFSKTCRRWQDRLGCIETLALFDYSCKIVINAIVDRLRDDKDDGVRIQAILILNRYPDIFDLLEEKNLRDIVFVLENHGSITVRASCAEFLGKHEGSKEFVVRALLNVLEASVDDEDSLLYDACFDAIERITGERPE